MSFQPHPPLQCFLVCYAEADEDDQVFIEDLDDDDYDDDAIRAADLNFSSDPDPKWKKW
jgi:hypothetical protein